MLLDIVNDLGNGLVDTALQIHWVSTCRNILKTLVDDSLCKDGGSSCAIAGIVASLAGYALYELSASVLELVLQLNLLGNGNTILGNLGCAKLLLYNNVAAFRTECNLYGVGKLVNTILQQLACVNVKLYIFCHNVYSFLLLYKYVY